MVKKHLTRSFLLCLVVTFWVLGFYTFGGFDSLELKAVDFRFQMRGNRPLQKNISVVVIDEKSIEKLGRWPWPRATHAKLVRRLEKAGAKAIAFDTLFTEPDMTNQKSDEILAETVGNSGVVVSAFFFKNEIDENHIGKNVAYPYQGLNESSSYVGFVNLNPDHDGVTRRTKLYAIEGEDLLPSLGVATYCLSEGKTFEEVIPQLPGMIDNDLSLSKNELFVNFADPRYKNNYSQHSYVDILTGDKDLSSLFNGKIVFVGATAAALFDMKAIPFVSKFPGVFVHANIVDNLINKNWIREIESYWTFLFVILVGLLFGFYIPRQSTWIKLVSFFVVVGGGVGFSLWLFSTQQLVVHIVPPLITALGCYGALIFYHLVIEEKEKRKIKGSFKQYLSPKVIEIITKDPSKLKLGGEEREVTIFFLDIAGFTTMSEALAPTQLVEVMNQCLTKFSNVILKQQGLINKYIGDCIMAFWNAPAVQPNHATLACLAGLECIEALPELNKSFQAKGLPSIDCRVGINTGNAVVGNMGSMDRFDYTVMGDSVNLASRLEGANKQYHSHIMISERTFESAKEDIEARDMDLIRVKGKVKPIKVFELLSRRGKLDEQFNKGRKLYHDALHLYREREFDDALHGFQEVLDFIPNDPLTRVYLERARQFTISPPPSQWDGVWVMKTK
ncbi:hypothetical protein BVX98_07665 [bacterium F11]|nr:hypothetical protein BVX98_07665 [bacterium F11]